MVTRGPFKGQSGKVTQVYASDCVMVVLCICASCGPARQQVGNERVAGARLRRRHARRVRTGYCSTTYFCTWHDCHMCAEGRVEGAASNRVGRPTAVRHVLGGVMFQTSMWAAAGRLRRGMGSSKLQVPASHSGGVAVGNTPRVAHVDEPFSDPMHPFPYVVV